jgi:hypothetical protein
MRSDIEIPECKVGGLARMQEMALEPLIFL